MAIAFLRANIISRQKGQSAVACAAYRAVEKLHDELQEKIHDYQGKSGHLGGSLILPAGVHLSREQLWNRVENFENRIDARLAKEFVVALPKELSVAENLQLAKEIAEFLSKGSKNDFFCVDWNVHAPHTEAKTNEDGEFVRDRNGKKILENNGNIHLHAMVCERSWDFSTGNFSKLKNRKRNSKEWLAQIKLDIGKIINSRLREKGIKEIDFRDFETRNKEFKTKTGFDMKHPSKHKGVAKTNDERRKRRRRNRIKREIAKAEIELKLITERQKAKAGTGTNVKTMSVPVKPEPQRKPMPVRPLGFTPPQNNTQQAINSSGRKTQCIDCGLVVRAECEKCKFKEKNISHDDDGYGY